MWVKICGIQNCKTATDVLSCGADAIGLNFYSPSPRSISVTDAQQIVETLPAHVTPVGVFVNHSLSEVVKSCQQLNLNTVQLH
ncbi:Phosphoribosylanthranilate isomerase, partial [hydrothermal vent metagenome]